MAINVQLNLTREEYNKYAGILRIHGMFVAPTLTQCLKDHATALEKKFADDVRSVERTDDTTPTDDAPKGGR